MTNEQVFESFISGDDKFVKSPSFISEAGHLVRVSRFPERNILVGLNFAGLILCSDAGTRLLDFSMMERAGAHVIDDGLFRYMTRFYDDNFNSLRTMVSFVGGSHFNSEIKFFTNCLKSRGLPNPVGSTVEEMLRCINRLCLRNEYAAAITKCPEEINGEYSFWKFDDPTQPDILALSRWTFFKDPTEAMVLRLGDTTGKMEFIKLTTG